jgi:hypothetical protein
MVCQGCGVESETKYVSFHQNIGALVVRFPKSVEGRLCKTCIHKHFWDMTTKTFFLGWWGTISLIITPFLIINNVGRYLFCLGMTPVAPGALPPTLNGAVFEQIKPHAQELFQRLNQNEDFEAVVVQIAERAGVTPGQVVLFVQAVAQSQAQG